MPTVDELIIKSINADIMRRKIRIIKIKKDISDYAVRRQNTIDRVWELIRRDEVKINKLKKSITKSKKQKHN